MPERPHVVVIGAGPAGLMAAETVAAAGVRTSIYDRMARPGRKFLLAGRGGLNLTHSEDFERLLARYGPAGGRLREALEAFLPSALRAWCEGLGQPTFVGSSGRVFPTCMKASPLLRAWLARLDALGAVMHTRQEWRGWSQTGAPVFAGPTGPRKVEADATILALGGASWPRLGSDGAWLAAMQADSIRAAPLRPANCGFLVDWSGPFRDAYEGEPLKGIVAIFDGRRARGEAIVTRAGLEGGAIYALSAPLRDAIEAAGAATLRIALRPDVAEAELARKLEGRDRKQSFATFARKSLRLPPVAVGLMREAALAAGAPLAAMEPLALARFVNAAPVRLTGVAPLARAISTAGGLMFDEIDDAFMLRRRPGAFVAGEMLDWEAPTGGYLLQAAIATGRAAGRGALEWITRRRAAAQSLAERDGQGAASVE